MNEWCSNMGLPAGKGTAAWPVHVWTPVSVGSNLSMHARVCRCTEGGSLTNHNMWLCRRPKRPTLYNLLCSLLLNPKRTYVWDSLKSRDCCILRAGSHGWGPKSRTWRQNGIPTFEPKKSCKYGYWSWILIVLCKDICTGCVESWVYMFGQPNSQHKSWASLPKSIVM